MPDMPDEKTVREILEVATGEHWPDKLLEDYSTAIAAICRDWLAMKEWLKLNRPMVFDEPERPAHDA